MIVALSCCLLGHVISARLFLFSTKSSKYFRFRNFTCIISEFIDEDVMNYEELVLYIESLRNFNEVSYLRGALELLGLEIAPHKVIVIAGTNGKGTTCATLQNLLFGIGKNVGLFTSPHMEKINERIKFNCQDISDEDFCNVFYDIRKKLPSTYSDNLSWFEWLTIMAAYYFFEIHHDDIDFGIFEVGLGGTKDSTNALPHDICAIAKLGYDHMNVLGNTIEEIADNKFGIITENSTVFHMKFPSEILALAEKYRREKNAKFIQSCDFLLKVDKSKPLPEFFVRTPFGKFKLNLPGARAAENTALALTIFNELIKPDWSNAHIQQRVQNFLENVHWPCRMERRIYKGRSIYLSGDHNIQGIESLIEILKYYRYSKIHIVIGICYTKDHCAILEKIFNISDSLIYLTETLVKALPVGEYDEKFRNSAVFISSDYHEALDAAIQNSYENDMILVTGSLYLTGEVRKLTQE